MSHTVIPESHVYQYEVDHPDQPWNSTDAFSGLTPEERRKQWEATRARGPAEVRVTDPNTGGQKGQKIERFDLIPAEPLRQLALVYGAGAKKYDDDNWRKGYSWRLSLGAMMRHVWTWVRGEKYDPEVSELAGQPVSHLACAAWHCFTLMEFQEFELGTDDIAEHVRQERQDEV
jgi:hypothetical protein